jgi:hypothetical protein
MLIVTVDLIPGGFTPLRRTIASMRIANISNLADVSDYRIEVMEAANKFAGTPARSAHCILVGHDRRQSVWVLLAQAAEALRDAEFDEL